MAEERNARKTYRGRVVSDKMEKTITVAVETYKNHPVYGKRIKYTKKYKARDENNEAKTGDIVEIMELVHYQKLFVSDFLKLLKRQLSSSFDNYRILFYLD